MLQPFEPEVLRDGCPVILYGAAMYGDLALNALEALGVSVFAFCDRVQAGKQFRGLDILDPARLTEYPEAHVLVCATKGLEGISYYLDGISHTRSYEISGLLSHVDVARLPDYCRTVSLDTLIEKYRFFLSKNEKAKLRLNLAFVAMSITERCSLLCKKCSCLIPFYAKPADDPYELIIPPFERFLACVDSIADMQVGGGEPFLHPALDRILTWLTEQEKIGEVSIFTNSTILPGDELWNALSHPKIKLLLDDYGHLSRKLPEIINQCDQRGIRYVVQKFERWDDLGDWTDTGETEEQLEKKYRLCSFARDLSFMKGRLYNCPTAARIADLGFVKERPEAYVDFTVDSPIDERREAILRLLYRTKFEEGCRRCRGIKTHELGIPVAEQAEKRRSV